MDLPKAAHDVPSNLVCRFPLSLGLARLIYEGDGWPFFKVGAAAEIIGIPTSHQPILT